MATVNKDFRIKAGLVVEGANATVNGEDIITTGSSTDDLQEGSTNLYFTNQRAIDAVGGDINTAVSTAIDALDTDDIEEGATNKYFTNQRALDATASAYDPAGSAATAQAAAEDYADGLAVNYDPAGSAAAAQAAAEDYADGLINDASNSSTEVWSAYKTSTEIGLAESDANAYTDTKLGDYTKTIDLDETIDGYGYLKSADLSGYATESYVNTAVDNLVDGAPGLLDTLNEIAAAINDDANYATTMTTALAGKQNELTAGANISIVSDTISVTGLASTDISDFSTAALSATASAYDVAGAAASAQAAAEDYADGLASNYEPAGTTASAIAALDTDDITEGSNLYFTEQRAIDALQNTAPTFTTVDLNSIAKQVVATSSVSMISTVNAITWLKSEYKSAKLLVKANTASHSQVSEVLISLDSADNVAITEFGIVYTDSELAVVSADVSGSDVRVRVTTLFPSTNVSVVGTLLV
jgi:hypothetical protein